MKNTLLAIVAVSLLVILTGFSINKNRARNMDIQINVKALSGHGLHIISPSDPQFDKELATLIKDDQVELRQAIEAIRPLCVFVKNTGTQDVVMYTLKWELIKDNGAVFPISLSTGSSGVLMGAGKPKDKADAIAGGIIRPNATGLITADPTVKNFLYSMKIDSSDARKKSFQDYMLSTASRNNQMLQGVTNITISLDGAFFEDGSFVGPDTANLFSQIQEQLNAQRDLATTIEQELKRGKTYAEVFTQIESSANKPDSDQLSPRDKRYRSSFKMLVDDLLRMRTARGDKAVMDEAQQPLRRPTPKCFS